MKQVIKIGYGNVGREEVSVSVSALVMIFATTFHRVELRIINRACATME